MVLWVQYQLSVSVINSSVCKEIKHKTTSNTFLFSWKSESHLRGWRWGSWRRPWCRPTPRPPSSSPPSPCLLKISDPCFCPNKLSRLNRFYPNKTGSAHMVVVLLASPTGDDPWWKMGTNRGPGANSGTNGRLVSEANCSCTSCEGTHRTDPPAQISTLGQSNYLNFDWGSNAFILFGVQNEDLEIRMVKPCVLNSCIYIYGNDIKCASDW